MLDALTSVTDSCDITGTCTAKLDSQGSKTVQIDALSAIVPAASGRKAIPVDRPDIVSPTSTLVFVIDTDVRRRASISYHLNNDGLLAEPFEDIDEFIQRWPKAGVVLIHDDEKSVASLMRAVCNRHTWLPVVAFSEESVIPRVVNAVLDGAVGYAIWPGCDDAFVRTVRKAGARHEAAIAAGSRKALAMGRLEVLSKREREILAGMVEGLSNRQIAEALFISPRTVELHRANLLSKLEARGSVEAIRLAIEAALPPFQSESATK